MIIGVDSIARRLVGGSVLFIFLVFLTSCGAKQVERPDHPLLGSKVVMRDVIFHSAALGREMRYRVVLPGSIASDQELPVAYLLHGGGGGFRDWTNYSEVARFAETKLLLVMPQGDYSYYVNAVGRPADRYEDYIVQDLLTDVEARFPIAKGRANRAIVGVSMGGFGAVKIALSHPALFVFAGALSPAIDVPRRQFSLRRVQQSTALRSIFGPSGSEARRRKDPFLIARSVLPAKSPYLFLSCGEGESLLVPNREFVAVLERQHLPYEFHVVPGGHDWTQWNKEVPKLFERLFAYVGHGA
jgi:putative tributyrin esterase